MKNLLVYNVSKELHRQFKTFCASKGITMSGAIKEFMQQKKSILLEADKGKLDAIIKNLQFIIQDEKKSDTIVSKSYINMLILNLEIIGGHKTISRWG